jgi:hypothetical protein
MAVGDISLMRQWRYTTWRGLGEGIADMAGGDLTLYQLLDCMNNFERPEHGRSSPLGVYEGGMIE